MQTPFTAPSLLTSMLHCLSRLNPSQSVKWLIFTVPYWTLPLGLMAGDVLQQQSGASAVPHIIGMLAGHAHHFQGNVWPKVGGGGPVLASPEWLRRR